MPKLRLTPAADTDLDDIFAYTLERFGLDQARRYGKSFMRAFDTIIEHPGIGTDQSDLRPDLRRLVHQAHAIYYRIEGKEIVVARILGPGQDPLEFL